MNRGVPIGLVLCMLDGLIYYTRNVWFHTFCMEEYASWILWGGSDKADSSHKSSKWLSKVGSSAELKSQAGCVWRKHEVSVL